MKGMRNRRKCTTMEQHAPMDFTPVHLPEALDSPIAKLYKYSVNIFVYPLKNNGINSYLYVNRSTSLP